MEEPVQTSESRILTTHTGSLPRSEQLLAVLLGLNEGQTVDRTAFDELLAAETDAIVRKQLEAGIDVGCDGELPRIAFHMYVKDRMSGFGGRTGRGTFSDIAKFPKWASLWLGTSVVDAAEDDNLTQTADAPAAVGELRYDSALTAVRDELDLFEAALAHAGDRFEETFVTAASPGIVTTTMTLDERNEFYADDEQYVLAVAEELKTEYDYIVSRGHVLQIDAPDLAMERSLMFQDAPLSAFLERVELHIEAINRAIRDIPRDRVRLHACWGNYAGPHVDDVELEEVLPMLYRANVGALSLPCGNPRHQHDWRNFKRFPLPDNLTLIVGVIDVTTNYVEHPQAVADRIAQFAAAVGDPHRIIAGTDCGFGTIAGYVLVAEDVVWPKLAALAAGAKIASRQLMG
jgi:5-methyltetrahydropteroyltriglutamate--homocysteine methyltransferase